MGDPVQIDVPGVGRVWLVSHETDVATFKLRRGISWTPPEIALLAGWGPQQAQAVAMAKALFDGRLQANPAALAPTRTEAPPENRGKGRGRRR